jgi:ketosteroid isomerase-like protein
MTLTVEERRSLVARFAGAVKAVDRAGIEAAASPDITWELPGSSRISGLFSGFDGVLELAETLAAHGYRIAVRELTFGVDDVAVEIRGTGSHQGRSIDVAVVNVLGFHDGKVSSVHTHFSDIDSIDAYFA